MPRQARIDGPGALHHIICRGIDRRKIFRDDFDRDNFVTRLSTILTDTSTRCYAWAFLSNHLHLLLQTGTTPVSTVMRRLLTGYAVSFNRRHHRSGHLFQNRYKSILCEEEPYLLELLRYIHLNPLRAGVVESLGALAKYPYSGHRTLLSGSSQGWQETGAVLERFGGQRRTAVQKYLSFIADGCSQGKRPDLTGGGLVRSAGGWEQVKSMRQSGAMSKSDERILGGSDFVAAILTQADEVVSRKSDYQRLGIDFDAAVQMAAEALSMPKSDVIAAGKHPQRVKARSLVCYWAVRELGLSATAVGGRLNLTQPAVSRAVVRGEKLAAELGVVFDDRNA